MQTAWAVARWFKIDKWLREHRWHFIGVAVFVAVCICWYLTGTFYGGVVSVALLIAIFFVARFVTWVALRIKVTTEKGVPINFGRMAKEVVAERAKFADADENWAKVLQLKNAYGGQPLNLKRKTLTATGDVRASINASALGGNLELVYKLAADGTLAGVMYAESMKVKEVSVQPTSRPGKATITFWETPPLARSNTLADLPASGRGRITFGFAEMGGAASIRHGLSLLAVGATNGGKSGLFKNAFADIRRDGAPMEMYFVDPKRMELARFKPLVGSMIGNIRIAGYCNTAAEAEKMFAQFAADMHARQERLAELGMVELKHPTPDFPARMIVVDEMADVKATFDKIDKPLPIVISQGRATQDSVFGLAQIAKIETLGTVRDLFALRAGLRMMTPENTKAALGISENDGAPCSRIPLNAPGTGYYVTDDGTVGKFRTAHVTDQDWDQLLTGFLPVGMAVNVEDLGPPCWGYIGPDLDGCGKIDCGHVNCCGYVGIAQGEAKDKPVERRRAQHRQKDQDLQWCMQHERVENVWRHHIADKKLTTVGPFKSVSAAKVWEERTIRALKPRWNRIHNNNAPDSNEALIRRAGMKTRAQWAVREYKEWLREVRALHQVKAGYAHDARVQKQRDKRERFEIGAGIR